MIVNSRGELGQTNQVHRLTFQCISDYITTCWSTSTVTLVASCVHRMLSVQVCLNHTPSRMSDLRAASSRRHGDAGTAVATRLRLFVCSCSIRLYCNKLSAGQSIARGFSTCAFINHSQVIYEIHLVTSCTCFSCSACLSGFSISCLCASLCFLHVSGSAAATSFACLTDFTHSYQPLHADVICVVRALL